MKVLLSWLREFAPFGDDVARLSADLSDLGLAVESVERLGEGLDGIVVAKVLSLRPHPDADRIQLVDVDAGDGEARQICCGAFNMAVGDHVPLATLGTVMPGGLEIARRKLRGEWSNGMLCSSRELGLGDDHEGILVLADAPAPGTPITDALGLRADVLWDLEVNPNRPDAMSVAGVARDLAARTGDEFAIPSPSVAEAGGPAAESCRVELVDPDLCGRFLVRVLRGVAVGSSPAWLANRLTALGMRPINTIVDLSNYVMLELGQPNHTYDLAKVPDGALRVRWARDGERLVTLDGVERVLGSGDGVIADGADTPIGIAGVMGGASTEIDDATADVLLEMAWWDPMTIARSSRRLGLRSEASMRFERGADPEVLELAAARFCQLAHDLAGAATTQPGAIDVRGTLPDRSPVRVRTGKVNTTLGTSLGRDEIAAVLAPIGFASTMAGDDLDVTIPSFRHDSTVEVDVVEEVARCIGYGTIPRTVPRPTAGGALSIRQKDRRLVRDALVGLGLTEVLPMPFLAPGDLAAAGVDDDSVVLTNPLDANESVLRTSLRPGVLKAVAYNASHRRSGVRVFEIGTVFHRPSVGEGPLPVERERLTVVLAGAAAPDAVAVWRALVAALAVPGARVRNDGGLGGLHPTRAARCEVLVGGEGDASVADGAGGVEVRSDDAGERVAAVVVGAVGEIDPVVAGAFGVDERVAVLDIDLGLLLDQPHDVRPYRRISRFPSSDLDLAFEVPDAVAVDDVAVTIQRAAGELLASVALFDVFRGGSLAAGSRSLAFTLRLQAADRTLTDDDAAGVRAAVVAAVTATHSATLRA